MKHSRRHQRHVADPAHRAELLVLLGFADAEQLQQDHLIEYLHAIQDSRCYLPESLQAAQAGVLRMTLAEIAKSPKSPLSTITSTSCETVQPPRRPSPCGYAVHYPVP